jgi:hypothetical protein
MSDETKDTLLTWVVAGVAGLATVLGIFAIAQSGNKNNNRSPSVGPGTVSPERESYLRSFTVLESPYQDRIDEINAQRRSRNISRGFE